jgi:Carboxypeptidase regulatory-like domain
MPRWLKYALLILLLLLLASVPLAKQFEMGAIEGFVSDDRGPIAMASIQARNVMTGTTVLAQSGASGYFRVGNLWSGRYSLWIQSAGHDSVLIPHISVERGQTVRENIQLARSTTGVSTR